MTPAIAPARVADRLSQGWRDGSAMRGGRGEDVRRPRSAGCPVRLDGGRLTLGQQLDSVWEGLRADGAAACPVCAGSLEGFGPATCTSCGSELR